MRTAILLAVLLTVSFAYIPFLDKVAVVDMKGEIGKDISASDVVASLDRIERDPTYVAVVLDINSGGGSAVEAHEIVRELDRMSKPKVARIGDMGASGAYWIASACDYIVADELSVVGSIGAASMFYSPGDLARRLFNVQEIAYPGGKLFGSPFFNETFLPYARSLVKSAGSYFIEDILSRRPGVENYTTGLPYLARDAPGLVDEYGGMETAIGEARKLAGARFARVERIETSRGIRSILKEIGLYSLFNGIKM